MKNNSWKVLPSLLKVMGCISLYMLPCWALSQINDTASISNVRVTNATFDPRKFISIVNQVGDTIYPYSTKKDWKFRPNRDKFKTQDYISSDDVITIIFDVDRLKNDPNFYGNISLEADVNGEPISVQPYSIVGKSQLSYGVNTRRPDDIIGTVEDIILIIKDLNTQKWNNPLENVIDKPNELKSAEISTLEFIKVDCMNGLRHERDKLLKEEKWKRIESNLNDFEEDYNFNNSKESTWKLLNQKFSKSDLVEIFNQNYAFYEEFGALLEGDTSQDSRGQGELNVYKEIREIIDSKGYLSLHQVPRQYEIWQDFKTKLATLNSCLIYLRKSGDHSMNALLPILGLGPIEFYRIDKLIGEAYTNLNAIVFEMEIGPHSSEVFKTRNMGHQLIELSNSLISFPAMISPDLNNMKWKEKFKEGIYGNLIDGEIFLANMAIKAGDILNIDVKWYNRFDPDVVRNGQNSVESSDMANLDDGIILRLVSLRVIQKGWEHKTHEFPFLINRIGEGSLRSNYPLNSSRFKPTAGITHSLQYYNDHEQQSWLSFRPLEPSFGITVSYCDFRNDETFEIGLGGSIGFFRNLISITGGYNFMAMEERPFFWGIGLSFSSLVTSIQNGNNLNSN